MSVKERETHMRLCTSGSDLRYRKHVAKQVNVSHWQRE